MKNSLIVFTLITALAIVGCKKDLGACKHVTETFEAEENKTDPATVSAQEVLDTLQKYPRLKLAGYSTNTAGWWAQYDIFYKGLKVFSDRYYLYKSFETNKISANVADYLKPVKDIGITPAITKEDAVKEAKKVINLDHTCAEATLGYYNQPAQIPTVNYELVWRISGADGKSFAYINAQTKTVIAAYNAGPLYED